MPGCQLLFTFIDGSSSIRKKLHELFAKATERILLVSHRVGEVALGEYEQDLKAFASRGGSLVLLTSTAHESRQRPALAYLKAILGENIEIHVRDNVHGKCMVVDGQHTVIMSANFAGDGVGLYSEWSIESHGWDRPAFELGIYLNDPRFAREVTALIEKVLRTQQA